MDYWKFDRICDGYDHVTLETKECKKRKKHYAIELPDILYKNPYKCHTRLTWSNPNETCPVDVEVQLSVVFEDYSTVPQESKSPLIEIANTMDATKSPISQTDQCIEITSWWFNVTSYQHKRRKFRLIVELLQDRSPVARWTSQPFSIRAKKPIIKPGSRKRKYDHVVAHEEKKSNKRVKMTSKPNTSKPNTETATKIAQPSETTNPILQSVITAPLKILSGDATCEPPSIFELEAMGDPELVRLIKEQFFQQKMEEERQRKSFEKLSSPGTFCTPLELNPTPITGSKLPPVSSFASPIMDNNPFLLWGSPIVQEPQVAVSEAFLEMNRLESENSFIDPNCSSFDLNL